MKFIVDAQLPKKLADWLSIKGFDTIHTLDLPDKNSTSDKQIIDLSLATQRIVISKDSDFYDRFFLHLEPYKLIYLSVGNLSTVELIALFEKNADYIFREIESNNVIEITRTSIITID